MLSPQDIAEDHESQQEAYYRELRLDRLVKMYLHGMHSLKHFEHSSVGIALAEKMYALSPAHNANS